MSTFTWTPSYEATEISKPQVRTFQASDGYEQRLRFGLNTQPKEWQLVFTLRTNTERDAIVGFLETQAGAYSFDWTSPRGITGKYVCQDWQVTMQAYNLNDIRATFRQVYEP